MHEVDQQVTPRTASFPCAALAAEITLPDPIGPWLFVNHFPNWQLGFELERERQAVIAARFVERSVAQRRRRVVMTGDLDAEPRSASVRFLTGRQSLEGTSVCYRDAWESIHPDAPGATFAGHNPLRAPVWDRDRRIDYIFVRCGHKGPSLDVTACALAFREPVSGVWASDHFGIVADLAAPTGPTDEPDARM